LLPTHFRSSESITGRRWMPCRSRTGRNARALEGGGISNFAVYKLNALWTAVPNFTRPIGPSNEITRSADDGSCDRTEMAQLRETGLRGAGATAVRFRLQPSPSPPPRSDSPENPVSWRLTGKADQGFRLVRTTWSQNPLVTPKLPWSSRGWCRTSRRPLPHPGAVQMS